MNGAMAWTLARRHELLRASPKVYAISAVSGTFVMNLVAYRAARDGGAHPPGAFDSFLLELVVLAGFVALLFKGETLRRCRSWEGALPLPARDLWRGHHLALAMGGLVLVGICATLVLLFNAAMEGLVDLKLLNADQLFALYVRPALLVLAMSGAVAQRRVDLADLADDDGWSRWRTILIVLAVVLLAVLSTLPPVITVVVPLAVSVWVQRAEKRIPATLDVLPGGEGRAAANAPQAATSDGRPIRASQWVVDRIIMRQLFKWPLSWIVGMPFIALFGLLLAGFLPTGEGSGFGSGYMRAINWFIVVYLLFSSAGHFLENLWRVDHLPVSRRRLLAWLVIPSVVVLVLGYCVGIGFLDRHQRTHEQLVFDNDEENYGLKVPAEFFRISLSGDVPLVQTYDFPTNMHRIEPLAVKILEPLPWMLWKPYTTPIHADAAVIAWQISRAVRDVYGVEIPADEIRERYLVQDGVVVKVREGGLTLQADYPELRPQYRGPAFVFLLGALIVIFLLVLGFTFLFFKPGITVKKCRVVFWAQMVLLLMLHLATYAMLVGQWSDDWILTGTVLSLAREAALVGPGGVAVVWIGFLVILALSWRWAESRFRAAEMPRGS